VNGMAHAYDDDADLAICLTTRRRARKPHKCATCGSLIEPGHAYDRHFFPADRAVYAVHADQAVCWVEMNEGH
jgi:hypothetical protein